MFSHSFLITPESATSFLGTDLVAQIKTTILVAPGQFLCLPLTKVTVDSRVWATQGKAGQVMVSPVKIHLKSSSSFPHQRQYPLKPEAERGLGAIVNNLKAQGLLWPWNNPCNTPILKPQRRTGNGD